MSKSSRKKDELRKKGRTALRRGERLVVAKNKANKLTVFVNRHHVYECLTCGAMVDTRKPEDVLFHENPQHRSKEQALPEQD